MAFRTNRRNGQHYADNIIDELLTFDPPQTWSVSSGTGTAATNTVLAYQGNKSLKIENTDPTADITVTNSVQSTIIPVGGTFQMSWYLYKDDLGEAYSGSVNIFKNGSPYNTQAFTLGGDDSDEFANKDFNEEWVRFVSDIDLEFLKNDEVTITITLNGISGYLGASATLYVDGIMLNLNNRLNTMPPLYQRPVTLLYNQYTGWGSYTDTLYTSGSPLTLIAGDPYVNLPNNAGSVNETQIPIDITTFYNGSTILGREGDGLNLTISFAVNPTTNNTTRVTVAPDIGGAIGIIEDYEVDTTFSRGLGVVQRFLKSYDAFTLDTWQANGATLKIKADQGCEIYGIRYLFTRTHKAR